MWADFPSTLNILCHQLRAAACLLPLKNYLAPQHWWYHCCARHLCKGTFELEAVFCTCSLPLVCVPNLHSGDGHLCSTMVSRCCEMFDKFQFARGTAVRNSSNAWRRITDLHLSTAPHHLGFVSRVLNDARLAHSGLIHLRFILTGSWPYFFQWDDEFKFSIG